jgi:predicted AlkP superfamily phosphohydrolase/phosphomutase
MVIGLDCASPDLVFDRWRDELPTLRSLAARGTYGVLRSCDPPITVPAWASMTSSRTPGTLGIYGFRNRRDRSYELGLADARAIRVPRVWDVLSGRGRPVIVLGVPPTYPASHVNGVIVSCFLTPDTENGHWTYPADLRGEIAAKVGRYRPDVGEFRTEDKTRLFREIAETTERRFRLAEHLLTTRAWDLFFMVEMGTDRIEHGFRRVPDTVLAYYRRLDGKIARLLEYADDDTAVLVVSDHGAKRRDGGICVNEWLRREGYLALRAEPREPTRLTPDLVDWERTTAWAEGGYYCRVFLNVAGREPRGTVDPADYERVRDDLVEKLEALPDDEGRPLGSVAHRPEGLYPEANGIPPDLLVYFGDLSWRSLGEVGTGRVYASENDTGPDDANHAHEGIYIAAGPEIGPRAGGERELRDVAPTILSLLAEAVPAEMEGASFVARGAAAART